MLIFPGNFTRVDDDIKASPLLGNAYEKSGSLLRPIFMHALFNGFTIATVLTQGPGWT